MKKTILGIILIAFIAILSCSKDELEAFYKYLKINKNRSSLAVGETKQVEILEGNGGYKAIPLENEKVAVTLKSKTIFIKGKKAGNTKVIVTDKENQKATIDVTVNEIIKDITVAKTAVDIRVGDKIEIPILQGSGYYKARVNSYKAKVELNDKKIIITGLQVGNAKVTVTDLKTKKAAVITLNIKRDY